MPRPQQPQRKQPTAPKIDYTSLAPKLESKEGPKIPSTNPGMGNVKAPMMGMGGQQPNYMIRNQAPMMGSNQMHPKVIPSNQGQPPPMMGNKNSNFPIPPPMGMNAGKNPPPMGGISVQPMGNQKDTKSIEQKDPNK